MTRWFRQVFPDAMLVESHPLYEVNHLTVRYSLERLGLVQRENPALTGCSRLARPFAKLVRRLGRCLPVGRDSLALRGKPCHTRIIGVVREPFEMLVSLFEYWRSYAFEQEPADPLIQTARRGTFCEFLRMAVVERRIMNYHDFFDMDGPASFHTRLLDFSTLDLALSQVCREFGVDASGIGLGTLNVGPSPQRDLQRYRTQAGKLASAVRSYFRWYYEEGSQLIVRGHGATAEARQGLYPCRHAWQTNGVHARGARGHRDARPGGLTIAGSFG